METKKVNNAVGKLVVLWSSSDKEVALKMAFMYVSNACKQGWWEDITLVVWGPSAKLLSEDKDVQLKVKEMMADGVCFEACVECANEYNVEDSLSDLGVDVKKMGDVLTQYIKENRNVLTF